MENNELLEFLEDMFCWMDENEMEVVNQEDIIFFMKVYQKRLQAEAEGMKQMYHSAIINKMLGESGIDLPEK
jgi:hypothetical protein